MWDLQRQASIKQHSLRGKDPQIRGQSIQCISNSQTQGLRGNWASILGADSCRSLERWDFDRSTGTRRPFSREDRMSPRRPAAAFPSAVISQRRQLQLTYWLGASVGPPWPAATPLPAAVGIPPQGVAFQGLRIFPPRRSSPHPHPLPAWGMLPL